MQLESSPGRSIRAVKRALLNENWTRAGNLACRAIRGGLPARRVGPAFTAAGKPELLVAAMWNRRDRLFSELGTVASFAQMVTGTQLADEYLEKLQAWADDGAKPSSIGDRDYLLTYRELDERALLALFHLKYGAWNIDSPDGALQEAARQAEKFRIAPETAEFFYQRSRGHDRDLSSWLHEFKTTQMLHHLFADGVVVKRFRHDPNTSLGNMAKRFCRFAGLQQHLDTAEAKRVFQDLDRSHGVLLSTFHGGFLKIATFFFVTETPDPHWVTSGRADRQKLNIISVRDNERTAAFQTVKALMQGKAVLMAPDGPHYGTSSAATIEVLGLKTTISHGAALMAYEANSETGWISALRQGDMFVPQFVPGPRRRKGEIYSNYRDRWLSFYEERLNCALSSGPENLIPFGRWAAPHAKLWN